MNLTNTKTVYLCTNCGHNAPKWQGKCDSCHEWNTYEEKVVSKKSTAVKRAKSPNKTSPILVGDITGSVVLRTETHDQELQRVLGGGIVPGSVVLVGGQPGIGKSTLLLQLSLYSKQKILYVSGEESAEQIKIRADRIGIKNTSCFIYAESDIDAIITQAVDTQAEMIIIDSIQTMLHNEIGSGAGSVAQIRGCTEKLIQYAKEKHVPIFIVGHITKEGNLAGPKVLEHMVDVVLQFEGDQNYSYRILRSLKNRFGSTEEIGIYKMQQEGMEPVSNPSQLFLSQHPQQLSGSAICASLEGKRPLLLETQALVSPTVYSSPQRSATGYDQRRMSMLLAVLEKRCRIPIGLSDVFLNIVGGIKASDPGMDLAILAALMSSHLDISIPSDSCFAGEVGLSGEIRAVRRLESRIQEADRLGFKHFFYSDHTDLSLDSDVLSIRLHPLSKTTDLMELLQG